MDGGEEREEGEGEGGGGDVQGGCLSAHIGPSAKGEKGKKKSRPR